MAGGSLTGPEETRDARRSSQGQTLAEFGIVISVLIVMILGIFQVGYLIYQDYVAMNLAREAGNLILRQQSLDEAEAAIRSARENPAFDAETRLILSVVQLGASGGPNQNRPIIIQRHVAGNLSGPSVLGDPPSSSYSVGPTYTASDAAHDTTIQAKTPLPNGLQINAGQSVFVAELYVKRRDIVPLARVQLPTSLYAVAYF